MPTHLLYVPTNRRCTEQVDQLCAEARLIAEAVGACPLALIEHGEAPWSAEHRDALARARARDGVEVLHVTHRAAEGFLRAGVDRLGLSASDTERLMGLLNPTAVAYGAGPNKAALLAAAADGQVLHRRDSDVRIDQWPAGPAHPCVPEVEVLGRRPAELGLEGADAPVAFVGTSSFGNAPHDRRDLLAVDARLLVDIERLAAPDEAPEKLHEDNRQYLTVDPEVRYTEDFLELDTTGRTVMLACAMAGIFRELPEIPIHGTLGSDYMRRNALRYLGRPIVFHSRKVSHRYDPARAAQRELEAVIDYARRDLRHMVLWPVLVHHHRTLREAPERFVGADGALDGAAYRASLNDALNASMLLMEGIPAGFAAVYRRAAERAGERPLAERLQRVAEGIEDGPDYVTEVADGLADYGYLIGHWPALVEAAAALGGEGALAAFHP